MDIQATGGILLFGRHVGGGTDESVCLFASALDTEVKSYSQRVQPPRPGTLEAKGHKSRQDTCIRIHDLMHTFC